MREVTASRLERLSDRERRLTAVAAVIGREFEFALLQRAAGMDELEAADGLEELVRRRIVHDVSERFDFVHDRIRELAYSEVLPPRRRLLHGAVGQALEELYAQNLEPHYAALGTHYRAGDVWPKALTYLRLAGAQSVTRSAYREAVAYFEQALAALERLPEGPPTLEQGVDLRCDLRNALVPLDEYARIFDRMREADVLAGRLGDDQRSSRIAGYLCRCFIDDHDSASAIEAGQRAVALATRSRASDVQVVAQTYLGMAYHDVGDFRLAAELHRQSHQPIGADARAVAAGQADDNVGVVQQGLAIHGL